jgi:hypothetical protein
MDFFIVKHSISPFYKSIIAEFKKCASNNKKFKKNYQNKIRFFEQKS